MAIFNVNGQETDSLQDAINYCREVWAESKKEAVEEQRREALAKPTPLDIQRAEAGVTPNIAGASAARLGNGNS